MTVPISFQRRSPALSEKSAIPPDTDDSTGLPLKNLLIAASSHTDPIADAIASVPATCSTESCVGFSASSS